MLNKPTIIDSRLEKGILNCIVLKMFTYIIINPDTFLHNSPPGQGSPELYCPKKFT